MASQVKPYRGVTKAYRSLGKMLYRTTSLLETGIDGLSGREEKIDGLLTKFASIKGIPGPMPKNYEPVFDRKPTDGNKLAFSMDRRTAHILQTSLQSDIRFHRKLRFHLYAVLTAAVWGHFETYLFMLFDELFTLRPALLKSGQQLSFKEAIVNRDDIVGHVAATQLERIGHFSLEEHVDYLQKRLKLTLTATQTQRLSKYYLIRNIIAHSSGHVLPTPLSKLPADVQVVNGEIRITKQFLERMMRDIQLIARLIEKHVEKKFF